MDEAPFSPLQILKQPPGQASPAAILRLIEKLKQVEATDTLAVELSWLNNNYQRALAHYVRRCSAARLRQLQPSRRYAVLVCFLWQTYRNTIDYIVDMHDKIITGIYSRAQEAIDEETRQRRTLLQTSLRTYRTLGTIVMDEAVAGEEIRCLFFSQVDRETVAQQLEEIDAWLNGKHSHVFHQVVQRFTYLRQYGPALLQHLHFEREISDGSLSGVAVTDAIDLLRDLNRENKRKLPEDASLAFIPEQLHSLLEKDDEVNKQAWECAL